MWTSVGFERLCIQCIIGTEPEERVSIRDLYVDVKVGINLEKAALSDDLSDTVDYLALAQLCRAIAQEGKFRLIEAYGIKLGKAIFHAFPVQTVYLIIRKPAAFEGAECALVEMSLERSELLES